MCTPLAPSSNYVQRPALHCTGHGSNLRRLWRRNGGRQASAKAHVYSAHLRLAPFALPGSDTRGADVPGGLASCATPA